MDRDTALRKIRKCLSLSKSSEPHEAARAMEQAQALMRQFDIDHPELQTVGIAGEWAKSRATAKPPSYEVWLANIVAKAFGCDLLWSAKWINSAVAGGYLFIGAGAAAEVAGYSFAVLSRKLLKARTGYTATHLKRYKRNKVAAADEYCSGWVYGVSTAVLPNPPDPERRAAIDAFKRINYDVDSEKKVATTSRELADTRRASDHSRNGRIEGKKTQLHQGLGGAPHKQLGLL